MQNLSRAILLLFLISTGASAMEKIDVNSAPLEELIKIVHIGEERGVALISLRPFSSLDDLSRIKGISSGRIGDIKKQGLAYIGSYSGETASFSKPSFEPGTKNLTKIDINAASSQDLQVLVGVGAVLSQRIINARPFYSLDEITKVEGIGVATLEKIKEQGLAWIEPGLVPPQEDKEESFDERVAAVSVPLQETNQQNSSRRLSVSIIALAIAFLSGITILVLKRNLESSPL
jgi:competence ComEA-like helix-hairpin-helix protein